jgi:integrase
MTCRTILRFGVENGILQENIAAKVKPPRLHVKPGKFLTWSELEKINFGKQTTRIRFLALHGLRYGEAAALEDTDIRGGRVHITKSKYGATKSRAGVRSVPHLSEFEKFAKHQNRIADALKPYGVNVHSLRKTYAYILKSAGVHVTTASKLLGHSDPALTLRVYTLVRDDETDTAGEAVRHLLGGSLDQM